MRLAVTVLIGAGLLVTAACGGVTTLSSDGGIEAGTPHDAADLPDIGIPVDSGRPECDSSAVSCRSLPPTCPKGEVPAVTGNCWAGHCVKTSACRTVKDCSVCNAETDVCAQDVARGSIDSRCVEMPKACTADRTCKCLEPYVCTTPSFRLCGDLSTGAFACTCPVCLHSP